jgi:hypothetical protein
MASFDLDKPSDDVDEEFARKLVRASQRTRDEMPVVYVDADHPASESELAQISGILGQTIWRRRPA